MFIQEKNMIVCVCNWCVGPNKHATLAGGNNQTARNDAHQHILFVDVAIDQGMPEANEETRVLPRTML